MSLYIRETKSPSADCFIELLIDIKKHNASTSATLLSLYNKSLLQLPNGICSNADGGSLDLS